LDAPPDSALVAGDDLVAHDPDDRRGHPEPEMGGAAVLGQLVDADEAGEHGAGPNDQGDAKTGDVLGPLQAVGVRDALAGRRDMRKPTNNTAEVLTSDRLWRASSSSPNEPVSTAMASSMSPVVARPTAETPMARWASWRSTVSSKWREAGNGSQVAVSPRRCIETSCR
jgi:hypothetical protein